MKTPTRKAPRAPPVLVVERVQTGVKIEKRLLKVLKGLAEYHGRPDDMATDYMERREIGEGTARLEACVSLFESLVGERAVVSGKMYETMHVIANEGILLPANAASSSFEAASNSGPNPAVPPVPFNQWASCASR